MLGKWIILFEINRGWMDCYKCEVPVRRLYFIRAFAVLGEINLNKYVCTLPSSFQNIDSPYWFFTHWTCCWNSLKPSINNFLNNIFVTSLFLILIFFTDLNALSLRSKFWCLVHKRALRSLECKGFKEKGITYVTII